MTARAPSTPNGAGPLELRVTRLEERTDHHDYLEGRVVAFENFEHALDKKVDELAEGQALLAKKKDVDELEQRLTAKIDEVKDHAKNGAEAAGSTADLVKSAQNLSAVLPPGVRGAFSFVMLIVVFFASVVTTLQKIGVLK